MVTKKGDAYIYEVDLSKSKVELYVGPPETLTKLIKKTGARAAINGSFFNLSGGALLSATFANGKKYRERNMGGHVLFRNKHGQYGIHSLAPRQYLGAIEQSIEWGIEAGPLLVWDDMVKIDATNVPSSIITPRHPRTAVGLSGNKMQFAVINGRRYGKGMTCNELGSFMQKLGSQYGVSFDGGGSSELAIRNNDGTVSIINSPSDGRERAVPTALLVFDSVKTSQLDSDKRPVLRLGAKGAAVKELQTILNNSTFQCVADGVFGPQTEKIVKAFQLACDLKVDGVVGPLTWDVLDLWGLHKASGKKISPNFKDTEFMCRDGSWLVRVHPKLLKNLELLRSFLNAPIIVNSGYRTPEYNAKLPGAASNSYHLRGMATDIRVSGKTLDEIANAARKLGFSGIGIYKKSGFVHVDVGPARTWTE